MPRSIAFIAALALLTGWIGWQAISLGATKPLTTREAPASPVLIAARYYDAVNETLTNGDPANLRSILHPRFIDHRPDGEEPGAADDLLDSLLAIRLVFPDLRISASMTVAHGTVALSSLRVSGGREGQLEQLPVHLEVQAVGYETLLIDDGLVMERWSSAGFPVLPRLQASAAIYPLDPAISVRTPRLERFSFDQFARIAVAGKGDSIVIVESGLLQVSQEAAAEGTAPGSRRMLTSGEALTLSSSGPVELKNPGPARAIAMLLVIPPFDPPHETGYAVQPDPLPTGIARELRVEAPAIPAGAGSVAITMCMVRIAPGVSLSNSGSALVFVNEGAAEMTGHAGDWEGEAAGLVLAAGQHLTGDAVPGLSIRAIGPSETTITLVSVVQANVPIPVCGVSGHR